MSNHMFDIQNARMAAWNLARAVALRPRDPKHLYHWLMTGSGRQLAINFGRAFEGYGQQRWRVIVQGVGIVGSGLLSCLVAAWVHWTAGFAVWIAVWIVIRSTRTRVWRQRVAELEPASPVIELAERRRAMELKLADRLEATPEE